MDLRQVRNNKKEVEVKEEDTEMLNDSISSEFDTIKDKTQKTYRESFWPAKPDTPKGFTYKGKSKLMSHIMEKIKSVLKKGTTKEIGDIKIDVLDAKPLGGALQVTVAMTNKKERGIALVDFWGPNKRKECTIMIKKSKDYDELFVNILAKQVIQPCLDCLNQGKTLDSLFVSTGRKTSRTQKKYKCDHCEYKDHSTINLRKHIKTEHTPIKNESIQSMDIAKSDEDTNTENVLTNLEKTSWEEKRVEDELMDISSTIRKEPTSHEAEEVMEIENQHIIDEVNKSNEIEKNQTNLSKRKRKRKKLSTFESIRNSLPAGLRPVPENIKHFMTQDSLILSIKGDGACALNAASTHIFEDQSQGRKFRSILNNHMERKFSFYSQKISFPYERQVGVAGESVRFDNSEEYLQYLRSNEAQLLWSDAEELIAIANLYQIDIRVITTRGPEDPEPTMATIGPDKDLEIKEFAMLQPGVVPTMTLLHTSDSHFDLVIPKDARIVKNMYGDNPYSKPESTELNTIKEEYENLKAVHTRCEKDIINLKDLVKELTRKIEAMNSKEKPLDEENDEFQNAKNLFNKKQMGFQRIGPQAEANKKPDIVDYRCINCNKGFITKNELEVHKKTVHTNDEQNNCKNCARSFTTKSELSKHMATHTNVQYDCNQCTKKFETKHDLTNHISIHTDEQLSCKSCGEVFKTQSKFSKHIETHTQDGDWNCDECSYQTNSHKDLDRHKVYHGKPKDDNNLGSKNCNFCTQKFNTDNELQEHKQRHKTFKPCRNIPDCEFGINCLYNHNSYDKNKSLCYECGNEFNTFNELMFHRKSKHTMRACENFMQNRCRFSSERCWFNHNDSRTSIDKHQTEQHKKISCPQPSKKSLKSEQSVFRNIPVNLAPPSTAPTEATWQKMITMMEYLNHMMQTIKKTNPFLSL